VNPFQTTLTDIRAGSPVPVVPGPSIGDTITLYFTRSTNQPDMSSSEALMSLISVSPSYLASAYTANWLAGGDASVSAAQRLVLTLGGTVNRTVLLKEVTIAVLPGGGLRDVNNACQNISVAELPMHGSFGDASQPLFMEIEGAIAMNYGGQAGIGVGDAIILQFNQWMNQLSLITKADVDEVFQFEPGHWASDYTGRWLDQTTLQITITAIPSQLGSNGSQAAAVGSLRVKVIPSGNLTSWDRTSSPCNDTVVISAGSWGDIVCAAALDVFSYRSILASFHPPPLYSPAAYSFQVSTLPTFPVDHRTRTLSFRVSEALSEVAVSDAPSSSGVPSRRLSFLISGLQVDTPCFVRVAGNPPTLASTNLPQPPLVFTTISADQTTNCNCTTQSLEAVCPPTTVESVRAAVPRKPSIGEVSL
jgi:hypothetical protein